MARKKKLQPTHFLLLNDDIPALGTGWRAVILKKVGHKWAHFTAAATGENFKVPVRKWEELTKTSERRLSRAGLHLNYTPRTVRFSNGPYSP